MSNRPSNREKINKIRDALQAVRTGCRAMPLDKHVVAHLDELEVENEAEYWELIEKALEEISNAGPETIYAGGHPPQKSYEDGLRGEELWAYCWESKTCGKKMYLKFVIKDKRYIHLDCHADKTKR